MNQTNKQVIKHQDVHIGDVLLFDVDGILKKGGRYDVDAPHSHRGAAYEMRVEEMVQNGINSFLVKGAVVNYLHGDGTYFSPEEFKKYQDREIAYYREMGGGKSTQDHFVEGVTRPTINIGHVVRLVSRGKVDAHPITKPVEHSFHSFHLTVLNEAVRFFKGRVPTNLDTHHLKWLLRDHAKPWRMLKWGEFNRVVFNKRKFREAFRRNVNRALYKIKAAENVSDFIDAESVEKDMASFCNDSRSELSEEYERIAEAYAELSKRWAVFGKEDNPSVRYDRVTCPKRDHKAGLSARAVFGKAYGEVRNRMYEERQAAEKAHEAAGSCYDDTHDRLEWDRILPDLDGEPVMSLRELEAHADFEKDVEDIPYKPESTRVARVRRISSPPAQQSDDFEPL